MGKFLDGVSRRIVELTAQQGVIQQRADTDIAAVQGQIDTLLEIQSAITKEPALEALYLKATALNLRVQE